MQVQTLQLEILIINSLNVVVIKLGEGVVADIEEEEEMVVEDGIINLHANVHQSTAYYATPEVVNDTFWYADSGATNYVTSDLSNLSIQSEYKGGEKLAVGNGQQPYISHIGQTDLAKCLSAQFEGGC
ncbi:hypothetical protein ACOSQ4_005121 [Xanthoceras sorbifolium]